MKNSSLAITALLGRSNILIYRYVNSGVFAPSRLVLAALGSFSLLIIMGAKNG
jgi:hypothetical protein